MACASLTSLVDGNEMGDCGGGLSLAHLFSLFSSDSSSQCCGGIAGYAVDPEPWDAGCAGGCVVPCDCVVAGGEPVCSWA